MENINAAEERELDRLLAVSLKLRGLAFLIESQRGDVDPPIDLLDIHWGVGKILTDLSLTVGAIRRELQSEEIKRVKSKKRFGNN